MPPDTIESTPDQAPVVLTSEQRTVVDSVKDWMRKGALPSGSRSDRRHAFIKSIGFGISSPSGGGMSSAKPGNTAEMTLASNEQAIGGLAGTGKTTILREALREMTIEFGHIVVLAPTGKAASVLRAKTGQGRTIHNFAYDFINEQENADGTLTPTFAGKAGIREAPKLVIVDESSMVNLETATQLRKFRLPILWVGDHGQLPPIGDDPGIMANPTYRLETIHRQAEGSAIICFAHHARSGLAPTEFQTTSGGDVTIHPAWTNEAMRDASEKMLAGEMDQLIVGFNDTRKDYNAFHRQEMGIPDDLDLVEGEKVIVTRTNYKVGVFNGEQFIVEKIHGPSRQVRDAAVCDIRPINGGELIPEVTIYLPTMNRDFTKDDRTGVDYLLFCNYAYAITAHKSQGSEWDSVGVIDQQCRAWAPERWRYTAATRAKKRLIVYA